MKIASLVKRFNMKVDLHNHTYLCKHALGIMEDYVQKAIDEKIDVFGFSDHNPMHLDQRHRMPHHHKKDYIKMYSDVKKQFAKEIKLLFAYEFDYLDYGMNTELLNEDMDYAIGSVHFIKDFIVDDPKMIEAYSKRIEIFKSKDADVLWEDYFNQIKNMANTGLFNIVGHMDLVKLLTVEKPRRDTRLIAKEALKAIKKSGMSVEINAAGLRKSANETYPSKELLEEIYSFDIPITFSSDAHAVEHIGYKKDFCEDLAKDIGFKTCIYYEKKEKIIVDF